MSVRFLSEAEAAVRRPASPSSSWTIPRVPTPSSVPSVVAAHLTSPAANSADIKAAARALAREDSLPR